MSESMNIKIKTRRKQKKIRSIGAVNNKNNNKLLQKKTIRIDGLMLVIFSN